MRLNKVTLHFILESQCHSPTSTIQFLSHRFYVILFLFQKRKVFYQKKILRRLKNLYNSHTRWLNSESRKAYLKIYYIALYVRFFIRVKMFQKNKEENINFYKKEREKYISFIYLNNCNSSFCIRARLTRTKYSIKKIQKQQQSIFTFIKDLDYFQTNCYKKMFIC